MQVPSDDLYIAVENAHTLIASEGYLLLSVTSCGFLNVTMFWPPLTILAPDFNLDIKYVSSPLFNVFLSYLRIW